LSIDYRLLKKTNRQIRDTNASLLMAKFNQKIKGKQ